MNLFYSPELNPESVHLTLPDEESAHAIRVLRMKEKDPVFLTDGKGMFYKGEIASANPKKCQVKIVQPVADPAKRNFRLTIAIAPTKSIDRFEWFLEKATEIGCDEIVPVLCRHSERTVVKTERLNKVLVSAMKQCLKSHLPGLHEMTDLKKYLASVKDSGGQKFIGHIPELSETEFPPQNPAGKALQSVCEKGKEVVILIGPEGGFSEDEVELALGNGFLAISLGNSRLRVETAGIAACSIVNSINSF